MSINAIGGVSGNKQSLLHMSSYLYLGNDVLSQPQPQPTSMLSSMMQVLLQVLKQGSGNLGQGGGGQRGGGFQGDCHGGQTETAQGYAGADSAEAAEGTGETLDSPNLDDGAHGLLDAIAGLLAAIAPLLGGMGDDAGGGGGGGQLSANDDAFNLAGLLSANGF